MNKTIVGLVTTIYIILSNLISANAEEIKGAFGIELGQVIKPDDPNSNLKKTTTEHYFFTPVNPIKSLSIYSVVLTPTTNKVIAIYGMGEKIKKSKCTDDKNVLVSLLTSKYGDPAEPNFSDQMNNVVRFTKDTGMITVQCDGFMEARLSIIYADYILNELAEKERIEIETKKTNADGL